VDVAKEFSLPVVIVERKKGEDRVTYDKRVHETIQSMGTVDVLACMGWMFILSPWFIEQWRNKILNVHPALLPKHPGAHAHELVLAAKDTESGMTIHFIDEGVDTGKILLQKTCPVLPGDTIDTLKERVQKLECEWYPKTLAMIDRGEIQF
jgi:formyltetrahydrofolate-dependent phosphoribosylglycinamide formyltransferase